MLRTGCFLILAFLAVLIAIPIVTARYLPWWGTLLLMVGELAFLIFIVPKIAKYIALRFAGRLFGMKSKALHDASLDVHRVTLIPRPTRVVIRSEPQADVIDPDDTVVSSASVTGEVVDENGAGHAVTGDIIDSNEGDDEDSEPDAPGTRYLRLECTLTPIGGQTPMSFYDPAEITLCPYDKAINVKQMLKEKDATEKLEGPLYQGFVLPEAGGREPIDGKLAGPQRLELIFKCPPTLKGRAKLHYYFESFGDFTIPA